MRKNELPLLGDLKQRKQTRQTFSSTKRAFISVFQLQTLKCSLSSSLSCFSSFLIFPASLALKESNNLSNLKPHIRGIHIQLNAKPITCHYSMERAYGSVWAHQNDCKRTEGGKQKKRCQGQKRARRRGRRKSLMTQWNIAASSFAL